MKWTMMLVVAVAAAALLAGCGGLGSDDEHAVACGPDGTASYDFGTSDPATLAKVRALLDGTPSPNGITAAEASVQFRGSVGSVECGSATEIVYFVTY
jgi:hypothetical protein